MNDVLILTMLNIPQISRRVIYKVIKNNEARKIVFDNIMNLIKEAKSINPRICIPSEDMILEYKKKAENIISLSKLNGIENITILDKDFPERLKSIDDPPIILYYKGNRNCIVEENCVAIIGTRTPTIWGQKIAEKLGGIFANENFIVVSGLAKGCDELAHKGCVEMKKKSIAVLPGGLDRVYPASNKKLSELILENGGCLISEYPIGSTPFKGNFIERDRIQSALSKAVIIVESDIVGGTIHTAEYTIKQNRILACYNHPKEYLGEKQTRGTQKLIKDKKAIPIYSKRDIEKLKEIIKYKKSYIENNKKDLIEIQQSFFE